MNLIVITKRRYFCAACKLPLFSSETKFNSGTGWPSFLSPINKTSKEVVDKELRMVRGKSYVLVVMVIWDTFFDDGPKPTGLRYCMNSGAMLFQKPE
jgi:peptide-methionine (R)-S-oxide reductase